MSDKILENLIEYRQGIVVLVQVYIEQFKHTILVIIQHFDFE
jgi:hypothetical protein